MCPKGTPHAPMRARPSASSCRDTCAASRAARAAHAVRSGLPGGRDLGACLFETWWAKLLMVIPASIAIARLFVIGDDACHGSYTKYDWLNKIVGRIAFLPSLACSHLWEGGPQRRSSWLHAISRDANGLGTDVGGREEAASKTRRALERIVSLRASARSLLHHRDVVEKADPAEQETRRRAPCDLHLGQRAGARVSARAVDHRSGALGVLRRPLDHLDAAAASCCRSWPSIASWAGSSTCSTRIRKSPGSTSARNGRSVSASSPRPSTSSSRRAWVASSTTSSSMERIT